MANNPKKYANLSTLQKFLENLKGLFAKKADVDTALNGKADSVHTHTISNVTNLQTTLDGKVPTSRTINNKALTSNITLSASDVDAAPSSHNHNDIYYTETEVDTKLSNKSDKSHNHDTAYDAKGAAADSLASAKSYTDTKTANLASTSTVDNKISAHNTSNTTHSDIRDFISGLTTRLNTLANSDDTTLDQMSEIVAYIKNNKSLIDGITTSKVNVSDIVNNLTTNVSNKPLSAAQGVAIKALIDALQEELDSHGHTIEDIDGLTTTLANKAEKYHGTHVVYLVSDPLMDGDASAGSKNEVSRADHRHPTDISRAAKTDLDSHTGNTTIHITSAERTNWNAAKTHADSAHAPSNAEKNQNAFSNIKVGSTIIAADTTTDTLELVGSNVTITPDATNDKITLSINNASLGQGMGYCSTAAATTAKVVSLSSYELVEGGVVTVEFVYGVPASATMNINSKGAQSIYYKGKAIENNVIKGGDRATFIYYSLRYHLISIDRWHNDIVDLQTNDRKVEQKVVTANANYPLLLAQYSQTADATGFAYFDSGVYLNPSTNTIAANISGTATGLKNLTTTVAELNYMDGVTSNVQTQLDGKSQVQIITWEDDD
jgi:hypothetical protein